MRHKAGHTNIIASQRYDLQKATILVLPLWTNSFDANPQGDCMYPVALL